MAASYGVAAAHHSACNPSVRGDPLRAIARLRDGRCQYARRLIVDAANARLRCRCGGDVYPGRRPGVGRCDAGASVMMAPNKRLKLAARVDEGMKLSSARRGLSAIR